MWQQFRRTVSVPTTLSQHSDDGKASQLGKPGNSLLQVSVLHAWAAKLSIIDVLAGVKAVLDNHGREVTASVSVK